MELQYISCIEGETWAKILLFFCYTYLETISLKLWVRKSSRMQL